MAWRGKFWYSKFPYGLKLFYVVTHHYIGKSWRETCPYKLVSSSQLVGLLEAVSEISWNGLLHPSLSLDSIKTKKDGNVVIGEAGFITEPKHELSLFHFTILPKLPIYLLYFNTSLENLIGISFLNLI